MGKSLGNSVFLLLFFCGQVDAASIVLKIFDTQDNELESVGVGQPFVLKVLMEGFKKRVSRPLIPHLELIRGKYLEEGYTSQSIQGQVTMKTYFAYQGRIDAEGSYVIGPVRQENEGVMITSNELTIAAHEHMKSRNGAHKKKETKNVVFADFTVDHKQVVVGQAITCTVRFYYSHGSGVTGEAQLVMPSLPGFVVGEAKSIGKGNAQVQGVDYQFIEWQWHMYPREAGAQMIPAPGVDFVVNSVAQRSLFRFMFQEIVQEVKRVHANVMHLVIDPLPPTDAKVVGVGTFSQLKTSLEPLEIKEGEAALLTVEIQGNGNGEIIDKFSLVGMPASVKYYESKKYRGVVETDDFNKKANHGVSGKDDSVPKTCFEFVIQALRAGEWEIPVQQCVYFDTDAHEYRTLQSVAIPFRITPAQAAPVSTTPLVEEDNAHAESIKNDQEELGHLPLNMSGPWYSVKERSPVPFWLFLWVLIAPLLALAGYALVRIIRNYYRTHERLLQSKRAFIQAQFMLKKYKASHNVRDLYALCMYCIACRCMVPEAVVSRSWIRKMLEEKQCSLEEIEQWEQFLDKLAYYAFAQAHVDHVDNNIYAQVERWIVWLEKKI